MLFRAFYALPSKIVGPDGKPVNALLGAANLILREVEVHEPRAVVLCFGPDAAAYRTELYPAYHAEREEAMPDELPHQFADSRDFFEAFGWTVTTAEDLEADDLLGTYARLAPGESFVLVNNHDPKPLRREFQATYPDQFGWDYLESGPDQWQVRIERLPLQA